MFNLGIFLIILFTGIFNLATALNYCDPKSFTIDRHATQHIGCNHNDHFAGRCVQPVTMTPRLREFILYHHNDLRNKIANGSLSGFQSARRMLTLTWDTELEYLAELNLKQCKMEHDEWCYANRLPIEDSIFYLLNAWFEEHVYAKQSDLDKWGNVWYANKIRHFTQMVNEKSSKVGCSIAKYFDTLLMACNYDFGNLIDSPIYVKGRMGSGCRMGCNPQFNGLCTVSENASPIRHAVEPFVINLVPAHAEYMQTDISTSIESAPPDSSSKLAMFLSTGPSAHTIPDSSRTSPSSSPSVHVVESGQNVGPSVHNTIQRIRTPAPSSPENGQSVRNPEPNGSPSRNIPQSSRTPVRGPAVQTIPLRRHIGEPSRTRQINSSVEQRRRTIRPLKSSRSFGPGPPVRNLYLLNEASAVVRNENVGQATPIVAYVEPVRHAIPFISRIQWPFMSFTRF